MSRQLLSSIHWPMQANITNGFFVILSTHVTTLMELYIRHQISTYWSGTSKSGFTWKQVIWYTSFPQRNYPRGKWKLEDWRDLKKLNQGIARYGEWSIAEAEVEQLCSYWAVRPHCELSGPNAPLFQDDCTPQAKVSNITPSLKLKQLCHLEIVQICRTGFAHYIVH